MRKIIIRGVLGGLALFAWSFIAHLPPIGTAGERSVTPAEGDAILRIMNGPMHERAVYILPGFEAKHQDAWLKKLEVGPAAVVVYNPHPADQSVAGLVLSFGTSARSNMR
jgi:hypothetical protein